MTLPGKAGLFCAALLLVGCESGQTIVSGELRDCVSGKPVADALVTLVGWRDYVVAAGPEYRYSQRTDGAGRFHIAHDRPVRRLDAVAPGYRTSQVHGPKGRLVVRLLPGDSDRVAYDCQPAEQCLDTAPGADGGIHISNHCLEKAR